MKSGTWDFGELCTGLNWHHFNARLVVGILSEVRLHLNTLGFTEAAWIENHEKDQTCYRECYLPSFVVAARGPPSALRCMIARGPDELFLFPL